MTLEKWQSRLEEAFYVMKMAHRSGCEIEHTDVCTCGAARDRQAFKDEMTKFFAYVSTIVQMPAPQGNAVEFEIVETSAQTGTTAERARIRRLLTDSARDGWELVTAYPISSGTVLVFRRQQVKA